MPGFGFSGGQMFLRVGSATIGKLQETLYCVGE
jgi:hypothetical protein